MRNFLNRGNMTRLALVSLFLTVIDTLQSFYLQRVVNMFSEANLLPSVFYNSGSLGYILYMPIEFASVFLLLFVLWAWASYLIWYAKSFGTWIPKAFIRRH